jgi:hypothetical protein
MPGLTSTGSPPLNNKEPLLIMRYFIVAICVLCCITPEMLSQNLIFIGNVIQENVMAKLGRWTTPSLTTDNFEYLT